MNLYKTICTSLSLV